jgi:hypothetical protein
MKYAFILIVILSLTGGKDLQGKWKLVENESFLNILTSEAYHSGTDEQIMQMAEIFQFVLDSTFYTFEMDSVFFADAGPGNLVKHKKGKWLIKNDTLFIFESGKFLTHRYLIHSLKEEELKLNLVLSDKVVSKSILTFRKVK